MAILQGKAYWAKVFDPQPGYDKTELEWSIDVAIDDKTRKELAKQGIANYVKNKGDEKGDYISFKRKAKKKDGEAAKPIRIVDADGRPWDMTKRIGNESVVNVQYALNPRADNKGFKPSILAIQVWELVEYQGGDREEFPVKNATEQEAWD